MDEQKQTYEDYEENVPFDDSSIPTDAETSGFDPRVLGGAAAILGIGAGVAWKKREDIVAWFSAKREAARQKKATKLLKRVAKLSGNKPAEPVEETKE